MNKEQTNTADWANWTTIISQYLKPSPLRSWWQLINSFVPYFGLLVAMYYSMEVSYWLTLALSIPAAGFLVRIFIIFHDCGHGSFFKTEMANRITGIITGMMVFTPYHRWHYEHQVHHKTVGNLDKRGVGDVMTMTVEEYKDSTPKQQSYYRWYRNPVMLLLIVPFFLFTFLFRLHGTNQTNKMHLQTHLTTLTLILLIVLISYFIGFWTFVLIQVPILLIASIAGVWMFYVQHQFEDVIWERSENWDYKTMAMEGSSYYKLPRILQFFTGNIGFHHIHHLGPKIPNYYLEKCHKENPIFQKEPLTFWKSFSSVRYRLWDETKHKLVSFKEAI
ncbi:MAG: fatty acid desaturase [Bacteroidetes bacterium]|nr:MAG: fatty acid desaturase [Bacteroidota bacterium]